MASAKCLALLSLITSPAAAFFLMPCWPITTQRLDPIVYPGQMGPHVHQVIGGSSFAPDMDYNSTQSASCTTCFVSKDKSNYWIPAMYFQHQDGTFERVEQVGSTSVYYFNEKTRAGPGETIEPFPEGLRMLAGDTNKRSDSSDAAAQAINYKCLNYAGTPTDNRGFPSQNCPDGVRAEVTFPSCWDGTHLDTDDHKSHMAYPLTNFENGACPSTHPHHTVVMKVEFIFDTNSFKDKWYGSSQPFVLANGDPTGFGLHADYVMGWDSGVLSAAVNECFDISGVLANCPAFNGLLPATQQYVNPGTCTVDNYVNEDVGGVVKAMPGCNAIQKGPGEATEQVCSAGGSLDGGSATGSVVPTSTAAASAVSSAVPAESYTVPAESYTVPIVSSAESYTVPVASQSAVPSAAHTGGGSLLHNSDMSYSHAPTGGYTPGYQGGHGSSVSAQQGNFYTQDNSATTATASALSSAITPVVIVSTYETVTVTNTVYDDEQCTSTEVIGAVITSNVVVATTSTSIAAVATSAAHGGWGAWKREIGDNAHRHHHRHARGHTLRK